MREIKRMYIAGKIGDLPKEVYENNFEQARGEVRALGYEPVTPLDLPHEHNRTWSSYMKEDMAAMLSCDAVYALRNWRQSPGAIIEINTALSCGLDIIQQRMLPKTELRTEVERGREPLTLKLMSQLLRLRKKQLEILDKELKRWK